MSKIQKTIDNVDEVKINKNHWIIINTKKNSIWKQPYLTYEGAKAELDYQISKLKLGQTHNYKIEQRGWIDFTEQTEQVDEFSDFDIKQNALANF